MSSMLFNKIWLQVEKPIRESRAWTIEISTGVSPYTILQFHENHLHSQALTFGLSEKAPCTYHGHYIILEEDHFEWRLESENQLRLIHTSRKQEEYLYIGKEIQETPSLSQKEVEDILTKRVWFREWQVTDEIWHQPPQSRWEVALFLPFPCAFISGVEGFRSYSENLFIEDQPSGTQLQSLFTAGWKVHLIGGYWLLSVYHYPFGGNESYRDDTFFLSTVETERLVKEDRWVSEYEPLMND